ncbi:MAG: GHKL domain-containing protein [Acidimicrobiaceae bacterium]|nr:GHKL domain-containing protein [Acidimicrobiaceae bacterium]
MDNLLTYVIVAIAAAVVGVVVTRAVTSSQQKKTEESRDLNPQSPNPQSDDHALKNDQVPSDLILRSLDSLHLGVVICDRAGTVIFRNRLVTSLVNGRHQDALAARALDDLLNSARTENFKEQTFELYGPPKRTYRIITQPLEDDGQRVGYLATLEDISDKKHLDEIRRDFVANVSHELKTPIGAIGLLAETLEAEEEFQVIRRLSGRIQLEAFRLGRIIEDLIDLSRIESEEIPKKELLSVYGLIDEAMSRILPSAEVRGVLLETKDFEQDVYVGGDRRQLISAIYNLLDNAVKYSDPGERVEVSVESNEAWVDIAIRDEGIGIPSRDIERVFERFYRVDQTRSRATGGTGLGLAIVRHVVNNHEGRILLESREGVGSTFTLRLPLVDPEET